MDYTITLTDTERKAMEYIAADVDDWITLQQLIEQE